jgi:hypothetical protein
MKQKKGLLYYIYCALGEKSHPNCNKTADRVALIRLLVTSQILITNFFIIGGVIINVSSINHHWNDNQREIPGHLFETEKERILKTSSNFPYD